MSPATIQLMHAARIIEKNQALYYRALASLAEDIRDDVLSERLNGLHADEQHHLSRLTVRLVELGEPVQDLGGTSAPAASLDGWEEEALMRENNEIELYESLLAKDLDERTRVVIVQFLDAERSHAENLGGKWMSAEP
jgi:rubrerythrin